MNNIEAFRNPGKNITLSKFEYEPSRRYVFDSHANTSHVWNSNKVESGRSSDGRMMFNQSIVFSYGHHFAIAMHLNTSEGEITLLNSNGYSPSTGKHKNHVWRAMSRRHYDLPDLTDIADSLRSIAYSGVLTGWTANRVVDYIKKHILDAPAESIVFLARIMRVQRKLCAYYRTALKARNNAIAAAKKRDLDQQKRDATNAAITSDVDYNNWIARRATNPRWNETIADVFADMRREYARHVRVAKQHLGKRALAKLTARHKDLKAQASIWAKKIERRNTLQTFARYKNTLRIVLERAESSGGIDTLEQHNAETLANVALYFAQIARGRSLAALELKLLSLTEKAQERVQRARADAQREAYEKQARDRAAWLAGDYVGYQRFSDENGRALLRVKGDVLETSHGANVPLAHAIKAFSLLKLCRESGRPWQTNGHKLRVGHYQIDHIDSQGNFKAGCHNIGWNEVERIALALGVFDAPAVDTSEHTN